MVVFEQLDRVHNPSSGGVIGVRERIAPCSRAKPSGGSAPTRSTMAAARGSVALASAFSCSVRVSVRSDKISSISVASCRLSGLSGATCGWS
jgi:hypothetical protein